MNQEILRSGISKSKPEEMSRVNPEREVLQDEEKTQGIDQKAEIPPPKRCPDDYDFETGM